MSHALTGEQLRVGTRVLRMALGLFPQEGQNLGVAQSRESKIERRRV